MVWIRLYVGAGKLCRASKAGGYVGRRPMGAQGRRLGVDAGSLAISRGEEGTLGLAPIVKIQTLMHRESLTMHEGSLNLMSPSRFFLNSLPSSRGLRALFQADSFS